MLSALLEKMKKFSLTLNYNPTVGLENCFVCVMVQISKFVLSKLFFGEPKLAPVNAVFEHDVPAGGTAIDVKPALQEAIGAVVFTLVPFANVLVKAGFSVGYPVFVGGLEHAVAAKPVLYLKFVPCIPNPTFLRSTE